VNGSGTAAGLGLLSATTWAARTSSAAWARAALPPCSSSPPATSSPCSCFWRFAAPWDRHSGSSFLLYAALGGFEGSLALAVFYRALAMAPWGSPPPHRTAHCSRSRRLLNPPRRPAHSSDRHRAGHGLAAIWLITAPQPPGTDALCAPPRRRLLLGSLAASALEPS